MDEHLALLSLIAAFGPRRSDLARALLFHPASAVARDPTWKPSAASIRKAERQQKILALMGIAVLPRLQMPKRLRDVKPPSLALFVRGSVQALSKRAVAIVGAREASATAERWAFDVARDAAKQGFAVVSGGAVGIDAAAHRGALAAGGATVAYLGVPADVIYPEDHRDLFEQILEGGGALVSEFPPGVSSFASGHALRNRLIAAHGDCLVVAEAAAKSGSLGTAKFAHSLKRPVWVPPEQHDGAWDGIATLLDKGRARPLSRLQELGEGSERINTRMLPLALQPEQSFE